MLMKDIASSAVLGEITLHYQPQVDLLSGRIIGAEALLRCRVGKDMLPTGPFIHAAEANGLIKHIGSLVMSIAFKQAVEWEEAGSPIVIAVNLSPVQAADPDLLDEVDRRMQETGVPPRLIEFELTEGVTSSTAEATQGLLQLKSRGFRVAIDDFGVGHSSLERLADMPFDRIKIDRGFIMRAGSSRPHFCICQATVDLAHRLGMSALAEGIEREEQAALVRSIGCYEAQGYLYGQPMPAFDLGQLLRGQSEAMQAVSPQAPQARQAACG